MNNPCVLTGQHRIPADVALKEATAQLVALPRPPSTLNLALCHGSMMVILGGLWLGALLLAGAWKVGASHQKGHKTLASHQAELGSRHQCLPENLVTDRNQSSSCLVSRHRFLLATCTACLTQSRGGAEAAG